ncbi:hypothetical protein [Martelella mangrovi]|uniref:Uncharacterized protein n=1 Tax=Martelella mangrovi TaxID=1397477 RepID=A0ABV2IBA0_9HYPH
MHSFDNQHKDLSGIGKCAGSGLRNADRICEDIWSLSVDVPALGRNVASAAQSFSDLRGAAGWSDVFYAAMKFFQSFEIPDRVNLPILLSLIVAGAMSGQEGNDSAVCPV